MDQPQLDALRAEAQGRADCADAIAARDIDALAALLSAGRTKVGSHFVGFGGVMSALGGSRGAAALDALDAAAAGVPMIKRANSLLARGALDLGDAETRSEIDLMVPGIFSAGDAAKLKALALVPDPVGRGDVEAALFNPDGSLK